MDYSWLKFYFSIFNTGIYLIILSTLTILCSKIKLVWKLRRDGKFFVDSGLSWMQKSAS